MNSDHELLSILARYGPLTLDALAAQAGTSKERVQRWRDETSRAGWIIPEVPDEDDQQLYVITDAGERALRSEQSAS